MECRAFFAMQQPQRDTACSGFIAVGSRILLATTAEFVGFEHRKTSRYSETHNVQSLLALLDKEFNREQLVQLRVQMGQPTNVRIILSRWKSRGLIEEIRPNHYCKK